MLMQDETLQTFCTPHFCLAFVLRIGYSAEQSSAARLQRGLTDRNAKMLVLPLPIFAENFFLAPLCPTSMNKCKYFLRLYQPCSILSSFEKQGKTAKQTCGSASVGKPHLLIRTYSSVYASTSFVSAISENYLNIVKVLFYYRSLK